MAKQKYTEEDIPRILKAVDIEILALLPHKYKISKNMILDAECDGMQAEQFYMSLMGSNEKLLGRWDEDKYRFVPAEMTAQELRKIKSILIKRLESLQRKVARQISKVSKIQI